MKRSPEIQINNFQLAILLDDKQKEDYDFILNRGVFCGKCHGICMQGIEVTTIILNSLNDILVHGICNVCKSHVARTIEFGEDSTFYKKANGFRKSISN